MRPKRDYKTTIIAKDKKKALTNTERSQKQRSIIWVIFTEIVPFGRVSLPIFFFALIRSTHILIAVVFITAFSTAAKAEDDSTSVAADTDTSRIKIYNCLELNGPYKISWQYDYEITGFQQYRSTNNLLRTFSPNVFTSGINEIHAFKRLKYN